jgi:hypothetical protein
MGYKVRLSPQAASVLGDVSAKECGELCEAIGALADDPFPPNSRDLSTVGTLPGMPLAQLEHWLQVIREAEYIPTRQAAEEFAVPPATLRRRARTGKLLAVKEGREWRFNRGELQVLADGGKTRLDEADDLALLRYIQEQEDEGDGQCVPWEEVKARLDR